MKFDSTENIRYYIALLVGIPLIVLVVFLGKQPNSTMDDEYGKVADETAPDNSEEDIYYTAQPPIKYSSFTDREKDLTVYYRSDVWKKDLKLSGHGFVISPEISLIMDECSIVYGKIDEAKIGLLKFSSEQKKDFGHEESFEIKDYFPEQNITLIRLGRELTKAEEDYGGYIDGNILAVPHFPYPGSPSGFLLISDDDEPLTFNCVSSLQEILKSRILDASSSKLDDRSNGVLSLRNIELYDFYHHGSNVPDTITRLVLDNPTTGKEESILPQVFSKMANTYSSQGEISLSGGKLYFPNADKLNQELANSNSEDPKKEHIEIDSIDIFTGELKEIPILHKSGEDVLSFFIKKDVLYYLEGPLHCNEYRAYCSREMSLKTFDLKTGAAETLVNKNSDSRDIEGFSSNDESIILTTQEWDEGYRMTGSCQVYTFKDKKISSEDIDKCEKELVTGSGTFYYFDVSDGKISPKAANKEDLVKAREAGVLGVIIDTTEYALKPR